MKKNTFYHVMDKNTKEKLIAKFDGKEWFITDDIIDYGWSKGIFKTMFLIGPEVIFPNDSEYKSIK